MKESKRVANVGLSVGSVAARIASRHIFGLEKKNEKNAEDLANALGNLKGPLMKVAQLLSTIPDILPQEYVEKLSTLQANAPSMGWLFVKRRMSAELGPNWKNKFSYFNKESNYAASLGQVHHAKNLDGKPLACKLQYPDMQSVVKADLKQLKIILALYGKYDNVIDTDEIYEELSNRLSEEIDYLRESKHMLLYNNILKNINGVNIPKPISELSSSQLLTMSWLEGKKMSEFYDKDQKIRDNIANNLFTAWYLPFYKYGVIHGDPHPGNYTVAENGSILNLLDFGCIRIFPPHFVNAVIDLYKAMRDNDQELAIYAYKSWGFNDLSKKMIETLNMWANYVYAPLLVDKKRYIQEERGSKYGREIAGKVYKELRKLGGVKPPKEFVLVDRAAIGLGSVFMHLRAKLNWHRMCEEMIENFSKINLEKCQSEELRKCKIKKN